ncbi:MoaD/ThiS family protein [Acinetobacter larvae]|uniref:Molybdopterin synthase sulfur carrier subunit n=1 Tax=Acinetobacter larvae TaxID=1789224 RepID=A0A1B2M055_9GAMM|nr:MoaD/ThiS family protein [Acinetobacter larvae]AOA58577.1 molybdopterin synthase sulfur carrier subunit [Acinetobacter larvae]
MTALRIQIMCYGAVEKYLPEGLILYCTPQNSVASVLEQLHTQYPDAVDLIENCACAIAENIVQRQDILQQDCILVLLSPVAGG